MKSVYVALPNDDQEAKPLVKSNEDGYHDETSYAKTLSTKMTLFIYILCAVTVLCASANLAASVYNTRNHSLSLEKLPRPDIFAGLPKSPKMHGHTNMPTHTEEDHGHSHSHSHSHEHTHDACKSLLYGFYITKC